MIVYLHWIKSLFQKINSTRWIIWRTLTHTVYEWVRWHTLADCIMPDRGADWHTDHLSQIPNDSLYEYHPPPRKGVGFLSDLFPLLKLELFSSDFRGCWRVGHLVKLVCLWCSLHESTQGLSALKGFWRQKPSLQVLSTMHCPLPFQERNCLKEIKTEYSVPSIKECIQVKSWIRQSVLCILNNLFRKLLQRVVVVCHIGKPCFPSVLSQL